MKNPPSDRVLSHYVIESDTWMTVTPVIVHGYQHERFTTDKTEGYIVEALVESGYGTEMIEEIWLSEISPLERQLSRSGLLFAIQINRSKKLPYWRKISCPSQGARACWIRPTLWLGNIRKSPYD